MNDIEHDIHEAFDAVVMPVGLKERTMLAFDARCACEDRSTTKTPDETSADSSHEKRASAAILHPFDKANQVSQSVGPAAKRMPMRKLGFAIAACFALLALGFGGFKLYSTETAFVGIDINPSIELGINCFDRVVSQRAINDDGIDVLVDLSLVNKSYDEAMAALSESDTFMTSVSSNGYVEISVSSSDRGQEGKLSVESERYIDSWPCEGLCHSVSSTERDAAHEVGMGVSRYQAAIQLIDLDPSITLDDCRSMPMREIRDRIAAIGGSSDEGSGYGENARGQGRAAGSGDGAGMGSDDSQGNASGSGDGTGSGNGAAGGSGDGSGMGNGAGDGSGNGSGAGSGSGGGAGTGRGPGMGGGSGSGSGPGTGNRSSAE